MGNSVFGKVKNDPGLHEQIRQQEDRIARNCSKVRRRTTTRNEISLEYSLTLLDSLPLTRNRSAKLRDELLKRRRDTSSDDSEV